MFQNLQYVYEGNSETSFRFTVNKKKPHTFNEYFIYILKVHMSSIFQHGHCVHSSMCLSVLLTYQPILHKTQPPPNSTNLSQRFDFSHRQRSIVSHVTSSFQLTDGNQKERSPDYTGGGRLNTCHLIWSKRYCVRQELITFGKCATRRYTIHDECLPVNSMFGSKKSYHSLYLVFNGSLNGSADFVTLYPENA